MRRLLFLALWPLLLLGPALAGVGAVSGLFAEGRFAEARQALETDDPEARPGEELLWRSRLESDPEKAEALMVTGLADPGLPAGTRQGLALQLAQLRFARGRNQAAYEALDPLLAQGTGELPGEALLIAALARRAAGHSQRARELLAGIRPDDPAFPAARYYLGDIGLAEGQNELALRYFESGDRGRQGEGDPRLQAGRWRALRASGQDVQAVALLDRLQEKHPTCLALVEIDQVLRRESEENEARLTAHRTETPDTVVTAPEAAGRYTLQLGAFSDRALALDFKRRHEAIFPDLFLTEVRDERGQFLYKVRQGSFVNPALARSEAQRLRQEHGLEIIVVEQEASFGKGR